MLTPNILRAFERQTAKMGTVEGSGFETISCVKQQGNSGHQLLVLSMWGHLSRLLQGYVRLHQPGTLMNVKLKFVIRIASFHFATFVVTAGSDEASTFLIINLGDRVILLIWKVAGVVQAVSADAFLQNVNKCGELVEEAFGFVVVSLANFLPRYVSSLPQLFATFVFRWQSLRFGCCLCQ